MQNLVYFWSHFKKDLLGKSNDPIYNHWLTHINCLDLFQKNECYHLILQAPSELHKKWVQENLIEKIHYYFEKQFQGLLEIQMKISPIYQAPLLPQKKLEKTQNFLFNPLYTFENFVPGQNTDLAYASSLSLSRSKSAVDITNPLFIHGPSGLGKTHLLNAIGQESLKNFPQKKIIYLSAERFLNEYITALQTKTMKKFRNKFRQKCHLLLIDDIHILSKKEGLQEEFFHTFNELYSKKIQVVLCSDQSPFYISSLQERIKTRLAGGLVADISYPCSETRLAILKNKMRQKNLSLSSDSLKIINEKSQNSIREMEGVLNKIKILTELKGGKLLFSEIEKILRNNKKTLTVLEINKKIAHHFNISLEDLKSSSRKKQIVRTRQVAMFFIKKYLKKSLKDIAQTFEKKDHTTVLSSLRKVEHLLSYDKEFQNILSSLEQNIKKEFQI